MPFTPEEKTALLAEKGIGKTILQRLAQMELDDVALLADADLESVLEQGAWLTGSSCWKNSPQARAAIVTAIAWAQKQQK
ncbi:MAG: recombinase RecA [Cardiobacteriaceae bacterium]|nr:recombinase RecA [Cardiobacteriaceae bacterium]